MRGVSAQRRRSQQGLYKHAHRKTVCGHLLLRECYCAHPQQITTDISLTFKRFAEQRRKRYWTSV